MGNTRYTSHLEDYYPFAGELSAANAIGTQLCDSVMLRLTRWQLTVQTVDVAQSGRKEMGPRVRTEFALDVGNELADAGRDGRTCLPRKKSLAQKGHVKDWKPYPVDAQYAKSADHKDVVTKIRNILGC